MLSFVQMYQNYLLYNGGRLLCKIEEHLKFTVVRSLIYNVSHLLFGPEKLLPTPHKYWGTI